MIEDGKAMSLVDGVSRVKSKSGDEETLWIRGTAFVKKPIPLEPNLYLAKLEALPESLIQEIREAYCHIVRVETGPMGSRWELGLLLVWIVDDRPELT